MFNWFRRSSKSRPPSDAPDASPAAASASAPEPGAAREPLAANRIPSIDRLSRQDQAKIKAMPLTVRWMSPDVQQVLLTLPEAVLPRLACEKYPRAVERLLSQWRQPALFRKAMRDLMLDDRGGRLGFPFGVVNEFAALSEYFDRYVDPIVQSGWTESAQR